MSRAAKKRAKKNKKKMLPDVADFQKRPAEVSKADDEGLPTKKPKLEDGDLAKYPTKAVKPAPGENVFDDTSDEEGDEAADANDADQKTESTATLESSYNLSLPNKSLTEILMMDPVEDEEKKSLISNLSATQRASCLFQAIINLITLDKFYKEYWEKKPLLIRAKENKQRFKNLLSLESIRKMSKDHHLYYARDLNVTKYKKGKDGVKRRVTLDKLPRDDSSDGVLVDPVELWSNYDNGCTVRLLCPHKHSDNVHALLSTLKLELQCMVGANAYLTPPKSSQGFAPHYDDIEAFCLQLEGSKRWKVYEPTMVLPRVSLEDFTPEDIEGKTPIMDVTLEEGDLLYMPRGWIHQACTLQDDNEHSLHLTISAMQQWAWVDLLDMLMPEALENAAMSETSTSLREGLPQGFLEYMGAMYEEPNDEKLPESLKKVAEEDEVQKLQRALQEKFCGDAKKRIMKVAKAAYEMIDVACDQLAKRFMSDRQPFALTKPEKQQTSKSDESGAQDKEIMPNTLCQLVQPGVARLILEDDKAIVYHCGDNSRDYHGTPFETREIHFHGCIEL